MTDEHEDDDPKDCQTQAMLHHLANLSRARHFARNITNLLHSAQARTEPGSDTERDITAMLEYAGSQYYTFMSIEDMLRDALAALEQSDSNRADPDEEKRKLH